MIGLLAIGIALILGVGLRIAAVSGTLMMLGMWAAEWPLAKFTSAGEPACRPTRSSTTTSSTPWR